MIDKSETSATAPSAPLVVTARLVGPMAVPRSGIALDAMLAAAVALRDGIPPPPPLVRIEIPVECEPGGRFHLCSFAHPRFDCYESRYVNRRFPIEQAQAMGSEKVRSLRITAGPAKSYRIPLEAGHVEADTLVWCCVGRAEEIRALLGLVSHIGKKRSVGLGKVRAWEVEEVTAADVWPGFPVTRDGFPLRPLPPGWPGLVADCDLRLFNVTYPYWLHAERTICAMPRGADE